MTTFMSNKKVKFVAIPLLALVLMFSALVPATVKAAEVSPAAVNVTVSFGTTYTGSYAFEIAPAAGAQDIYLVYCATARKVTITTTHNDPIAAVEMAAGYNFTVNNAGWYSMGAKGNTQTITLPAGYSMIAVQSARYTTADSRYTIRFT